MAKKYKGYKGAGMRRTKTQLSEQSRQLLRQALTNAMQATVSPSFLPLTKPLIKKGDNK